MSRTISKKTAEAKTDTDQSMKGLIIVLIVIAIATIGARLFFLGTEKLPDGDYLWRLSINISTDTKADSTSLRIFPPFDTPNIRTIERALSHPGFNVKKTAENIKYPRSTFIVAIDDGMHTISADYLLHFTHTPTEILSSKKLSTSQREVFFQDNDILQVKSYAVREALNKLPTDETSLIDNIFKFTKKIPPSKGKNAVTVPQVLNRNKATIYDRAITMVALSRAGGIPARLVTGVVLQDDFEYHTHYWVEVLLDEKWHAYDIHYGYQQSVPINYLPMRRNGGEYIIIENGKSNQLDVDLNQEFNHPYLKKTEKKNLFSILDLSRLPLDARNEIALLLLLPLGALITALFRHMIGVHSYGVFTPTLLALALVYANIATTMSVFIVVITMAVAGRSLFPASLSRIPRLSIIFTLIAFIMAFSVSVLNYFNIAQEGNVFLLPIIILTSIVDRFYSAIEDKGLHIAMIRMGWTFIITLLCLPIIQFESLGHLILNYPESHLVTLALFLLISLYKGKQITQIPHLKFLSEPVKEPVKSKKSESS